MKLISHKDKKVSHLIDYNENKVDRSEAVRIAGNLVLKRSELTRAFEYFAAKAAHGNTKKRFIHLKVSLHPQDRISNRKFAKISETVLKGLGLEENPFIVYRHYDQPHQHIHIIICRASFAGKLVSDAFDGFKMRALEIKLAEEFQLTASANRILTPAGIRLPQLREVERMRKTGEQSYRNYVQEVVSDRLERGVTLTQFVSYLERRGVVMTRVAHDKGHYGVVFTLNPHLISYAFKSGSRQESFTPRNAELWNRVQRQVTEDAAGIPTSHFAEAKRPIRPIRNVSFRATNLGPYFKWSTISSKLLELEPDTLEKITLNKRSDRRYTRDLLTNGETGIIRSLALAAHHTLKEDLLGAPGDISISHRNILGLNTLERKFLDDVFAMRNQVFVESEKDRTVRNMVAELDRLTGSRLKLHDRIFIEHVVFNRIAEAKKILEESNNNSISTLSKELNYIPGFPEELKSGLFELLHAPLIFLPQRKSIEEEEQELKARNTLAFIRHLETVSILAAENILLHQKVELTCVPSYLLKMINDERCIAIVNNSLGDLSPFYRSERSSYRGVDQHEKVVPAGSARSEGQQQHQLPTNDASPR